MSSDRYVRYDICEAYYMYAVLYHQGQGSRAYRIFGRLKKIGFKPGAGFGLQSLTENGRAIFDNLVAQNY